MRREETRRDATRNNEIRWDEIMGEMITNDNDIASRPD